MLLFNQIFRFAQMLFDTEDVARHATPILKTILEAQSARLSEIAQKMPGTPEANYKRLQRFIQQVDAKPTLGRLFQADAPLCWAM